MSPLFWCWLRRYNRIIDCKLNQCFAGSCKWRKPLPPRPRMPDGDSFYYFTLGHLQEQEFEASGDADQATGCIDSYKKALALQPDSTVIQERLAEIYAKSQHIRDAVVEAQGVLKAEPDNIAAHRLLAQIYVRTLGDADASDAQQENLSKAVEQFQAILKLQPDDAYSALWLARLYRFENQHDEAEKVLRGVLHQDPENGPSPYRAPEPDTGGRRRARKDAIESVVASRRGLRFTGYLRIAG